MRGSTSAQSMPNDVSHRCEQEGGAAPQKDGLGDGGYTQRAQATMFDDMRGMFMLWLNCLRSVPCAL